MTPSLRPSLRSGKRSATATPPAPVTPPPADASCQGRQYPQPNDVIEAGRYQLALITRRFFAQLRQPKWLTLSSALYPDGKIHLHSSQISGFGNGRLKDPSPKAFAVLGHLNLSLFASLHGGLVYEGIGDVPRLPDSLRHLWGGLTPMVDPTSGEPLGPAELFEINIGLRDLGLANTRTLPPAAEAPAAQALGRHLRMALAAQGRDFLSELPALRAVAPSMEPLLMGKAVPGPTLVDDLPALADCVGQTPDELWMAMADAVAQSAT